MICFHVSDGMMRTWFQGGIRKAAEKACRRLDTPNFNTLPWQDQVELMTLVILNELSPALYYGEITERTLLTVVPGQEVLLEETRNVVYVGKRAG